eukprot:GDKK01014562.1.p1 GENE.GDKK01014562.1~~GDKK01014562.1.p1  ORF type:complete len:428 (-),score=76.28 GDKK01014562.1:126-1409(-)
MGQLLILDALIRDNGADAVGEEEAKVSFVWMLGEFCDFIEGGPELLQGYLENLLAQEPSVQLSLITAVVKLFLRNPEQLEPVLTSVLETLTQRSKHPDIRDRAYGYWRLLAKGVGVEKMKKIVHGHVAPIDADRTFADGITLGDLRASLNTAAVVYGKPPRSFLPSYGITASAEEDLEDEDDIIDVEEGEGTTPNSGTQQSSPTIQQQQPRPMMMQPPTPTTKYVDPLEELFSPTVVAPPAQQPKAVSQFDPHDPFAPMPVATPIQQQQPTYSSPPPQQQQQQPQPRPVHQDNAVAISAVINSTTNVLTVVIKSNGAAVSDFAMQINRNALGLQPSRTIAECAPRPTIPGGASDTITVPLFVSQQHTLPSGHPVTTIEVGLKTNFGLVRFFVPVAANAAVSAAPTSPMFGGNTTGAQKVLTVDDLFS